MKRIAIVTSTRAEYGLLLPLIRKIIADKELDLDLIVTGGHLSVKQGYTISEIIDDGFPITHIIPILDEDNSPYGISVTMANAIKGFAKCFQEDKPDMTVILGDRTELLGIASAALNERIPIAHIHGGEITEGAVDDCIRHAITKMSYLHFTATEVYRKRVIQLGEDPNRVFNVGTLGAENILTQELMRESDFRSNFGIPSEMKFVVVTFHPVTMDNEDDSVEYQTNELCKAMCTYNDYFYIVTGANADAEGDKVNEIFEAFSKKHKNVFFVHSLGMNRYLSSVKYAAVVLGNSSSGILEAPVLGTPTVNIGDRQKGRIMAESVISCGYDHKDIENAMYKAFKLEPIPSGIYGDGHTSEKIIYEIKKSFVIGVNLKKGFTDWRDDYI